MSGILLPTDPDRVIETSRIINAFQEKAFRAWTDPKHLINWWGPKGFTNTFHVHDLKVGGKWSFIMHGPDGTNYPNESVFVKIDGPNFIAWNHISAPQFQVQTSFEAQGNEKTKVIFKMVFEDPALCAQVKSYAAGKNEENIDKLEDELKRMK